MYSRESSTSKFIMIAGMIFWVFIIAYVVLKLLDVAGGTGTPEPTLGYAILVIMVLSQVLLWVIGNCIIIPLSYLIFFVLLIGDIRRARVNNFMTLLISNKHNLVYITLAVLGFILGGISSVLTILYLFK